MRRKPISRRRIVRLVTGAALGAVPLLVAAGLVLALPASAAAQTRAEDRSQTRLNPFRQLGPELPTPNDQRTASGAPGPAYWQQKVDYEMAVELDDARQRLSGVETVVYHNNSPDPLSYLWVQLDQNRRAPDSLSARASTGRLSPAMSFRALERLHDDFDGGFKIEHVRGGDGKDLPYTVVDTMMRIDLPAPLGPGGRFSFEIKWWYNINDRSRQGGRSGYDRYEKDGNYVYAIAQFFPRLAVYEGASGWQHKQFLGSGEFALPFGDYKVAITVPADHIVGATGELQNPGEVLTPAQRERLERARQGTNAPVLIVTEAEAVANEKAADPARKTWMFEAKNVRDFAFASSRKFIWDALATKFGDRAVLNMSFYPKEGNPLWGQYSTRAVAHAVEMYSRFTFDYPYPVAISVLTGAGGGMEYPMVSFNGGKPEPDGTYSEGRKHSLIGVIIHEVGHNFFPMIVNSDERQWAWMDEGLNTFMEYLAEQEWDRRFAEREGPAYTITEYMKGDKSRMYPIMTDADIDLNVGANAYAKTAAGLNILRETVLGRELFDFAFKEYSRRWMFKHPTPADFFRTMEDASGRDLDWFWRGWFFGTEHVDQSIEDVRWMRAATGDPKKDKAAAHERADRDRKRYISNIRNAEEIEKTAVEKDAALRDFYDKHDPREVFPLDEKEYREYLASLTAAEKKLLESGANYYEITLANRGGMIMPVILRFNYEDGSEEVKRIPAEIWRQTAERVSKVFVTKKPVRAIELDPFLETADVDERNNRWVVEGGPDYFKVVKDDRPSPLNEMQRAIKK